MPVLFYLVWLILNGRITPELVLLGFPVAAAAYLFACRVLGWSVRTDVRIAENLPVLALYVLVLIREIVRSSFAVIRIAVSDEKPRPVLFEFSSGLKGNRVNALLANSITLTPGTYTVFQEGDHFLVHCLMKEYADSFDDHVFIRILKRLEQEKNSGPAFDRKGGI